jgi:hypothetical protein
MKQVSWPQVALVLGTMAILVLGAVTLAGMDKDPTIILTLAGLLAVPILGALGVAVYQKLDQVKEVSNGNLNRAHDMLEKHTDHTANALTANTEAITRLVTAIAEDRSSRL